MSNEDIEDLVDMDRVWDRAFELAMHSQFGGAIEIIRDADGYVVDVKPMVAPWQAIYLPHRRKPDAER